ncbi:hypothetical protein BDF20DRAFT_905904 [Mycotypha africana]|uniref:uncharacterized protein n=1 Tax=Mycotypha africana TaxID=64632 RepID=UPI002300B886|nr:uncharacterized protein BDF20DRAFT_905904 [Mycotypha africana]KAI8979045.1 hypothetical protein BDF20DRAFT_905904 [Mycotypha africana]
MLNNLCHFYRGRTAGRVIENALHNTRISFAKKHPLQIKKENLAKKVERLAELERSRPSYIISKPTPFFNSLHTPESAYNSNITEKNDNNKGHDYQHFLTNDDEQLLFKDAPRQYINENHLSAVEGMEQALVQEESKVNMVKRMVALQNGNAKAVQLWNIHRAIDWFKRKEGDTGSPEVQAAILTVRIHNLNSHLQQHKKDKHNYRQLRHMVHQRARILKYLKRKDADRYYKCLEELGLETRAVEGEITI